MINHCDDDRLPGRALLLAPFLLAMAFAASAQKPELMPTVTVRPAAGTAAPSTDCTTGLAPAPPRLELEPARPAEMPRAVERATAASRDTAALFRRVQDAAEANDRTSFKAALDVARDAVKNLDSGSQKTRAAEILKVYDDIERVWDYSFASPVGAFFSAASQGGTLLTAMSRYPGYSDFITKESFVDQAGERFYPTSETRAFLTSQAARLLLGARLGDAGAGETNRRPETSPRNEPRRSAAGASGTEPPTERRTERTTTSHRETHHPPPSTKSSRSVTGHPPASEPSTSRAHHRAAFEPSASSGRKTEHARGSSGSGGKTTRPAARASQSTARTDLHRQAPAAAEPPTVASVAARNSKHSTGASTPPPSSAPATPSLPPASASTTTASTTTASTTMSRGLPATSPGASSTVSGSSTTSGSAAPPPASPSDTAATNSTVSSATTVGSDTTTTSESGSAARTTEPAVPAGSRAYLSYLMVAIGLIVLIVLIRASK